MLLFSSAVFGEADVYAITDFGAVSDGETLNTAAFQDAIDACAETGGGTVHVPPGRFVTGTLDMGAVILGSTNVADYPPTLCEYPSRSDRYTSRALIWGEGLRDIAITGYGTIDGQGAAFASNKATEQEMAEITSAFQQQGRYLPNPDYFNRPFLIRLISCKYVHIENIRLRNSAMWMQQYLNCEFVSIRGINVINHGAPNNDMIDIDGCRYVTISDCYGDTGDDALTLKSTGAAATEHVAITNCVLSSHCNAVKMGTESTGGFKDITITNCVIKRSPQQEVVAGRAEGLAGIALEIVDGGVMDRIAISNVTIEGTTAPIFLRLGNRARPAKETDPKPPVGAMRNISISNVVATGASSTGCAIAGLPGHPIENLALSNVRISFQGGGTLEHFNRDISEEASGYPECTMFGTLPAYGFYIRHARGVLLDDLTLSCDKPEQRPAIVCKDVNGLRITGLAAASSPDAPGQLVLRDARDAFITDCRDAAEPSFVKLEGSCENIRVENETR